MDPDLDMTGRPWLLDEEWSEGMSLGALLWIQERKSPVKQKCHTFKSMLMGD